MIMSRKTPFQTSLLTYYEQNGKMNPSPCLNPMTVYQLLHEVLNFKPRVYTLPEEPFRMFWTILLKSYFETVGSGIISRNTEFKMNSLIAYERNALADIVFALDHIHNENPIPIFMIEVAASSHGENDHKDFQKLAAEMSAALLTLLGLTRNAESSVRKSLRVFGAFIGGYTIQWCIMYPVFDDTEPHYFSLVFQAEESWKVDFLNPDFDAIDRGLFCGEKFEYIVGSKEETSEAESEYSESLASQMTTKRRLATASVSTGKWS
jgi:hypothetical protein